MLPGFTAVESLAWPSGAQASSRPGAVAYGVRVASCFGDCFSGCVADGGMTKAGCSALCRSECGGTPPDNPPYVCTPTDNSVNHTLCVGAQDAWKAAASAVCTTALGGVPGIGAALVGACVEGVNRVAEQSKAQCPPAVICV